MTIKNNVTRMLESRRIPFQVYELPDEKIGAVEAAKILGVDPELVFKTIVVERRGRAKPVLALVPGPREVDLKALARALNEKKVHLTTQKVAEQLTGLKAGGISPLALINRGFDVVVDQSAEGHEQIYVSGGQRGLDIRLPTNELLDLTNAKTAAISIRGKRV
jgi:Cys-tRNA(Pro)/Cys-tRNA(Cys) deacylase